MVDVNCRESVVEVKGGHVTHLPHRQTAAHHRSRGRVSPVQGRQNHPNPFSFVSKLPGFSLGVLAQSARAPPPPNPDDTISGDI